MAKYYNLCELLPSALIYLWLFLGSSGLSNIATLASSSGGSSARWFVRSLCFLLAAGAAWEEKVVVLSGVPPPQVLCARTSSCLINSDLPFS